MNIKDRIKNLVKDVFNQLDKPEYKPAGLDVLTDYPSLYETLNDLFDNQYFNFVKTIDWVSPIPTTFRIVLVNGAEFYLIYTKSSWIAQVAGKKYFLIKLPQKQRAVNAISRLLRHYYVDVNNDEDSGGVNIEPPAEDSSAEGPPPPEPEETGEE